MIWNNFSVPGADLLQVPYVKDSYCASTTVMCCCAMCCYMFMSIFGASWFVWLTPVPLPYCSMFAAAPNWVGSVLPRAEGL